MIPGFTGRILLPDDPGYEAARRNFNAAFQYAPQLIAYCLTPADVKAAIRYARQSRLPLCLRSSGHCVAGHSGGNGLLLDLSLLTRIQLEGDVAHVGAATPFSALIAALRGTGWHLPVGLCDSVCAAGFTQGGGYGLTSRRFGMMADRVIGFTVLLADESMIRVDEGRHPDLFWALRGAGGGHFGVVLEISYRLARLDDVWAFSIEWNEAEIVDVIDTLLHDFCGSAAPDELGWIMNLGYHECKPTYYLQGIYAGMSEAGRAVIRPLIAQGSGGALGLDVRGDFSQLNAIASEMPYSFPENPPVDFGYRKWSGYLNQCPPRIVWAQVLALFRNSPNPWTMIYLESYGGAINRVDVSNTAFVHRHNLANLVVNVFWGNESDRLKVIEWLQEIKQLLRPWVTGHVYPNYRDPWLEDYRHAYWGEAYPRLERIKAQYDPHTLFKSPQHIGPAIPMQTLTLQSEVVARAEMLSQIAMGPTVGAPAVT